ncbi:MULTISPECIES: adenosylmethionine decarboxylase [unclassified Mesorhizobium]|nr:MULTISPECIES: adenosylmethionine decarboxylase [unclassified Mesorhizobium]TGQ12651.1 adenosylmethionine decarboxylase [Mesorhizobium sp. M2E.F.Ca.ET.219.01.1.1]TGT70659.1 adenosylmethionine decarboxylase [Mesorhizobium sp. M2E.F.Ca.ET.166.01.1.1]TGV98894.1 adenosylmethionine decarboxylase [Mesorhizobium sp. M2E.F.Ca.ET.154.01.1.1]
MDTPLTVEPQAVQAQPFAPGLHLLVDFWQCRGLRDAEGIERALREAAAACGATVLGVMLHNFGEGAGITGVVVLAESHISIHTWPETGYAAIDLFMCGHCDPRGALPVLAAWFSPGSTRVTEHRRG